MTFKCHSRSSNVIPIDSSYMSCYIYIFIHQMMVATTKKIIRKRKENLTKLNYNNYIYAISGPL